MPASKKPSDEDLAFIKTQVKLVWVDGQPRFEWLVAPNSMVKVGQLAGTITKGRHTNYRGITFSVPSQSRRRLQEHNLLWWFLNGEWPTLEIDHRDRNGLNNKPSNMRLATSGQNGCNTRRRADNTTGTTGLTRSGRKNHPYAVDIRLGGTRLRKRFTTETEALTWLSIKRKELHGDFAKI